MFILLILKVGFLLTARPFQTLNLRICSLVNTWAGSCHDQTIFNSSDIRHRFESGEFGNYILVGDSGYRNTKYLATPLLEVTTPVENLYNESQIRTRNVVERSYGVLKRRFPVLSTGLRVKLSTVRKIIKACSVLHNIALDRRDILPRPEMDGFEENMRAFQMPPLPHLPLSSGSKTNNTNNIRTQLLQSYFPRL